MQGGWCRRSERPELDDVADAADHDDPELGKQGPQHVDDLGALTDDQVACPVQEQHRLLTLKS